MVGMREMEGRDGRKKRNSLSLSSFLPHNTGEDGTFIPFKGRKRETWRNDDGAGFDQQTKRNKESRAIGAI